MHEPEDDEDEGDGDDEDDAGGDEPEVPGARGELSITDQRDSEEEEEKLLNPDLYSPPNRTRNAFT